MKKLLPIILCLPLCVFAQTPPPAPASAQDVTDGTATYKFISPYSLAQSGVTGGGATISNQVIAAVPANFYTNNTPHYLIGYARLGISGVGTMQCSVTNSANTRFFDYTEDALSASATSNTIAFTVPPYGWYKFAGQTTVLTAGNQALFYYATNGAVTYATTAGSVTDGATQSGLAAGSYEVAGNGAGLTNIASSQFSALKSFQIGLNTNPPVRLIFDDDWGDIDGLHAHAIALALQDLGECEIVAFGNTTTNENSVAFIEVLNNFYGYNFPTGVRRDSTSYSSAVVYETVVANLNSNRTSFRWNTNVPNVVSVYRRVLANSPDLQTDIIAMGVMINIQNLYNSPADSISPLTGAELWARKVRKCYLVAGIFPFGYEFNFYVAPASATIVHSLTNVIYIGVEQGEKFAIGGSYTNRAWYDPIYQASTNRVAVYGDIPRQAWGAIGVLAAVRGTNFNGLQLFTPSSFGTNLIHGSPAGSNTFYVGTGSQQYWTMPDASTNAICTMLEDLFRREPSRGLTGKFVARGGDTIYGNLSVTPVTTNAISVGTALVVDTVGNKTMFGVARDSANNPIINARVEIVGSNATATVEAETVAQFSRSTGAGLSFAQGARFVLGRYKTPSAFSGDTSFALEVKTDNSGLLNTAATWTRMFSGQGDGNLYAHVPLLLKAGSTSAVSIGQTNDANTGIYFPAADQLGIVVGGVEPVRYFGDDSYFPSTSSFFWAQGALNSPIDTGMARSSAGLIEFNNGTAATYRDIRARAVTATNVVFTTAELASWVQPTAGGVSLVASNAFLYSIHNLAGVYTTNLIKAP